MHHGYRVSCMPLRVRIPGDVVARFRELPVANVSDVMARMTAGGSRLRPMHGGGVLAGPALTVKARPGDNLMMHKAIDIAEPGDIIVVDGGGDLTNALAGELMVAHAIFRGLGGFVVNGAIRDVAAIRAGNFPVFAAGVTHRGPYKDGPGEINVPVAIDGMVINPGDLMLGDDDGLIAVAMADAEDIYRAAQAKHAAEDKQMAAISRPQRSRLGGCGADPPGLPVRELSMSAATRHHIPVRPDWLALRREPVLEPGREIVDAHHHLWDRPGNRYLLPELLEDLAAGHRVVQTVFVQCRSMYRAGGPEALRLVGETEFANGVAAMSASGFYGAARACAAIVGCADRSSARKSRRC